MVDARPVVGAATVPVVLVSACALLLLSFNNRVVSLISRQRSLHRELIQHASTAEMCGTSSQLQGICKQLLLVRAAIILDLLAIAALILCGACMALGEMYPAQVAAVVLFAAGNLCVLLAVSAMLWEAAVVARPIMLDERRLIRELEVCVCVFACEGPEVHSTH